MCRSQIGTHEDLPLPVGPKIAFKPGLMIPLKKEMKMRLCSCHLLWNSSGMVEKMRHTYCKDVVVLSKNKMPLPNSAHLSNESECHCIADETLKSLLKLGHLGDAEALSLLLGQDHT